ncbi:hypothetical protein SXCC_03665 [Gluconacetobacter sp. SXCC-1]|nr:hypothetical protein SXCC_03665 [Gluconacetobacter sp. SXCC-1]
MQPAGTPTGARNRRETAIQRHFHIRAAPLFPVKAMRARDPAAPSYISSGYPTLA